jgi:hypothetical protein
MVKNDTIMNKIFYIFLCFCWIIACQSKIENKQQDEFSFQNEAWTKALLKYQKMPLPFICTLDSTHFLDTTRLMNEAEARLLGLEINEGIKHYFGWQVGNTPSFVVLVYGSMIESAGYSIVTVNREGKVIASERLCGAFGLGFIKGEGKVNTDLTFEVSDIFIEEPTEENAEIKGEKLFYKIEKDGKIMPIQ